MDPTIEFINLPERKLSIAARVQTLPDAWTFVMASLDEVGEAPRIEIKPVWHSEDGFFKAMFDVVVAGEPRG